MVFRKTSGISLCLKFSRTWGRQTQATLTTTHTHMGQLSLKMYKHYRTILVCAPVKPRHTIGPKERKG